MPPHPTRYPAPPPFAKRVTTLLKSVDFVWFIGHLTGFMYSFASVWLGDSQFILLNKAYSKAWVGVLLSYAIVVYFEHGFPRLTLHWFTTSIKDENFQYFCMALYWYFTAPFRFALFPYTVFALFHILAYARSHLLPVFFPQVLAELQAFESTRNYAGLSWPAKCAQSLEVVAIKHHTQFRKFVLLWEVLLIPALLLVHTLMWRRSLLDLVAYGNFLRLRYAVSPDVRSTFALLRFYGDRWFVEPRLWSGLPTWVTTGYVGIRNVIGKLGQFSPTANYAR